MSNSKQTSFNRIASSGTESQVSQLRQQIDQLSAKIDDLRSDNSVHFLKINELQRENDSLRTENGYLRELSERAVIAGEEMVEDRNRLKSMCERLAEALENLGHNQTRETFDKAIEALNEYRQMKGK